MSTSSKKKHAINAWANMEIQNHPYNKRNIIHACKKIQEAVSDTQLVLNLSCMKLSSLPDVIFRIPHLKTLVLAYNELTSFSLSHMPQLTSLDLEDNQLTSFSLSHMKNLAFLYLSNNQLSSFLSCDLPSVTHIYLRNNNLSYLGQDCISSINTHQHITLDLRGNPLSNEGRTQIQKNFITTIRR